jgi:hypothetical protein
MTKKNIQKIMKWHNCLHHAANPAVMARAIRSGAWPGVDIEPKCIKQTFLHTDCMSCLLGKLNRLPRSIGSGIRQDIMGHTLSVDWKPVSPMALGGAIWFYAFVECSKGYKFVTTSRVHNGEALYQAIYEAVLFFKRYGHYVRVLRMDAGKVEGAEGLHQRLSELQIGEIYSNYYKGCGFNAGFPTVSWEQIMEHGTLCVC